MKKRLTAILLATLMLFAAVPVTAADYVLPEDYGNYPEFEWEVEHGLAYLPDNVTAAANLWYMYEAHRNGAAWPEEYIEVFEGCMEERALGSDGLSLYGYEWKNDKLSVDFGVTFDVEYYWHVGNAYTELYGPTWEDYCGVLTVAVTNKNDGSLVRMIDTNSTFIPELRYDEYNAWNTHAWQFLSLEEAKAFEEYRGIEPEYTDECRMTVEVSMPDDFDPGLYDVTVYYIVKVEILNDVILSEPAMLSDPFEISLDGYGEEPEIISSAGPDDVPGFSFSFKDELSEEYADYFENLLIAPVSDKEYVTDIFNIGYAFGELLFETGAFLSTHDYDSGVHIRNGVPILALTDKTTGDILAMHTYSWMEEMSYAMISTRELPEYFDPEKHELLFFNYMIDYYPDKDYTAAPSEDPLYYVSDPVVIDVTDYIYGDADKNGRVNVYDVTLMLKNIAGWSGVGVEFPDDGGRYDTYSLLHVSIVLKIIAGWEKSSVVQEHEYYGFETYAAVRYYAEKQYLKT